MNKQEYVHALRYATEATKEYLMQEYKRKFPHYFGGASLETRLATLEDYFIPPSIANKCIVVVKTRFDETSCNTFGCYPFKKNSDKCDENDPLQWIRLGNRYKLACQKSCRDHSLDTEWSSDNRCILSNPLKKVFASMPEKLFQRASRHVFHGGFDIIDGHLKINKRYCDAYGLDFVNGDCVPSGGQKFLEWLLGTTTIRAIKVGNLKPLKEDPPPIPNYMNYKITPKKVKRSLSFQEPSVNPEFFHEMALEISKDFGRDVSEYAIEQYLKRKAPKFLSKAIENISVKIVLKNSVVLGMKQLGTLSLKALGTSVGVVTTIYALYELINGILDSLDPYDYLKVIDKETLEKIDSELDYVYYEDGVVRPELTPENIWDNEILSNDEDNENRLNFMIAKVEEYLQALENIPPNEYRKEVNKTFNQFVWLKKETWNNTFFICTILVITCFTLLFLNWIHIWACCLFFAMLFYKPY